MALLEAGSTLIGTVVPSLGKLLVYELELSGQVKKGLHSLEEELKLMHTFLEKTSCVPLEKLEEQDKAKVVKVRKLTRAIEPRLHSYASRLEGTVRRCTPLWAVSNLYINHQMAGYIQETLAELEKVRELHNTYPTTSSLGSTSMHIGVELYIEDSSSLVGVTGAIDKLTEMLSNGNRVSIAGMGGLGKTALARAVYNKMKWGFHGAAFVTSCKDAEKLLYDISDQLHIPIRRLGPDILQLQNFLANNRCLIVMDDIWDKETWDRINHVLKDSKIIITTRNLKVAEHVGGVYRIEPLSLSDSKKLLHTKIFGAEAKTHDPDFDIVSDKVLTKCGGVPIAITKIGRFLAKNKSKEWHRAYESIGFDKDKRGKAVEDIKNVLSRSYYALPYVTKKCFLYLSLFPEDHWIEKNMLIWRWVAEGLVPEDNEHNLGVFEHGEKILEELIDMSMIQWAVSPRDLGQGGCRLHYLMLDLVRNLSGINDQNFSTVLGCSRKHESTTIHRLAIHGTSLDHRQNSTTLAVGEVLSLYATNCPGSGLPRLSKFARLRVMDLEDCDLSVGKCKLKDLKKLDELEYLGISGTPAAEPELPKKIGRRRALQTLDVTAYGISELPPFVAELRKLRCLRAGKGTRMTGRVGKLTSLEELWLHSADKSPDFVTTELRKLTKLRVLVIHFDEMDQGSLEALVESLRFLEKLKVLQVWSHAEGTVRLCGGWEGDAPFPELRQLLLFGVSLPRLAPWIHWSSVPNLSRVLLQVEVLEARDLETLGKMPRLRSLYLRSEKEADHKHSRLSYTASRDEFSVLEYLNTNLEFVVRRDDDSNNGLATSCIVEDDGFELNTLMKRVMGDDTRSLN